MKVVNVITVKKSSIKASDDPHKYIIVWYSLYLFRWCSGVLHLFRF